MKKNTKMITRAGVIGAFYIILIFALAPLSYNSVQFRIAEGLTVLPCFYVESVPALFVGCFVANLVSPFGILDAVIGSISTLIAGILTRIIYKKSKNVYVSLIPPVVVNAVMIPLMYLIVGIDTVYYIDMGMIFLSQLVFVYGCGLPCYFMLKKEIDRNNKYLI